MPTLANHSQVENKMDFAAAVAEGMTIKIGTFV